MSIRTDLALEAHDLTRGDAAAIDGVTLKKFKHGSIRRTVVDIINNNGSRLLNKQCGRYITIEAPELTYNTDDYEPVCKMLADDLRAMCGSYNSALVVGLGNHDITPDSLGTSILNELVITGHLKKYMPDVLDESYGNVYALSPGVMGTTGIETVEIVKGVVQRIEPDVVIAVDALAGADIHRVCSTIQIADTGIAPGSGIGNDRKGLNYETLGRKVIAIGVPTVIAAELLGGNDLPEEFASVMVTTSG